MKLFQKNKSPGSDGEDYLKGRATYQSQDAIDFESLLSEYRIIGDSIPDDDSLKRIEEFIKRYDITSINKEHTQLNPIYICLQHGHYAAALLCYSKFGITLAPNGQKLADALSNDYEISDDDRSSGLTFLRLLGVGATNDTTDMIASNVKYFLTLAYERDFEKIGTQMMGNLKKNVAVDIYHMLDENKNLQEAFRNLYNDLHPDESLSSLSTNTSFNN